MSYEEIYRRPFTSVCACGRGSLRYYQIVESNDWGQEREHNTSVEILCAYCKDDYHFEQGPYGGDGFLVPNGLSFPKSIPILDYSERYTTDEEFVGTHEKCVVETMIADMTTPKHRFIKDLQYQPAIEFAEEWAYKHKKRSLSPMIDYLRQVFSQYDELVLARKKKTPKIQAHNKQVEEGERKALQIEEQSFPLRFVYDSEQDKLDHEKERKEQQEYIEAHKYDPFDARVTYDDSCKADSTGRYWDSFHIVECIDPQFLILDKPQYGSATITIVKKYKCKCIVCGKERIVDSSEFRILYEDNRGYYPVLQCDCHNTTSFEAKAMAILNNFGVSYAREYSFEGLVGDYGHPLRFDFALFSPEPKGKGGNNTVCLLLELQGPHHFKQGEYDEFGDFIEDRERVSSKARLEQQRRYDNLKQKYCTERGIALEYVPYTKSGYDKLEEAIKRILWEYELVTRRESIPF